ncbi:hypothetical protein BD408DRAFT_419074 [Parasitella parasitica]|nr:hypothetical protein BD408DRAFT_419074 [Parasitella parasitica]
MSGNMNNMNNMNNNSTFNDFITDFKFDAILSELQALKAMVTEMYNSRSYGRVSLNSTSSAVSDTLAEEESRRFSYFRQLISDEARVSEIYNKANDTVRTRSPQLSRKNITAANRLDKEARKEAILAMCKPWLLKNVLYDPENKLSDEEIEGLVQNDLNRRYQATYQFIGLFVQTRFSCDAHGFRWSDLSKRAREEVVYIVEHLLEHLLGTEDFLPLGLAPKGWAASHLIAVQVRNQAKAKAPSHTASRMANLSSSQPEEEGTRSNQSTEESNENASVETILSDFGFGDVSLSRDEESGMPLQVGIIEDAHSNESSLDAAAFSIPPPIPRSDITRRRRRSLDDEGDSYRVAGRGRRRAN